MSRVLTAAAVAFCCVGLIIGFVGLRDVVGAGSTAKLWLVLFVAAGIGALVLLRTARDLRGRVRLGVGWAVLGAVVVGVAVARMPSPGPGAPIGAGWAVLVVGGSAVLIGGVVLAASPLSPKGSSLSSAPPSETSSEPPPVSPTAEPRLSSRRTARPRFSTNWLVESLAVATVVGLGVGGYVGAVHWTDGQNVNLTVADATPPPTRESTVDGRVQWLAKTPGEHLASAGGVLTTLPNGLQMLDPASGRPRWTYRRADVGSMMDPVVSDDGTLVAAVAVEPSPNPKPQVPLSQRLLVLDAVAGTVVTDAPLDPRTQGTLSVLGRADAYFSGGPDDIRNVQISAVALTGANAGQRAWVYYPKDGCDINAASALGTEFALSTTCGTIAMLDPDGSPRWEFHTPVGGAQIWPLAGSPAGTVQAVTEPAPTSDPAGLGVSAPSGVVSLDARTGAVRWRSDTLPQAPFTTDSPDSATATMSTFWAGDTAVLVYDLQHSQRTWIVGYRASASPKAWSLVLPDLTYNIQPPDVLDAYIAVTPDGRIVLPTQNSTAAEDQSAHPGVIVVNGRDGHVNPSVAVDGAGGIPDSTGFFGPTTVLSTPGGVVLDVPGLPFTQASVPTHLLIGLH